MEHEDNAHLDNFLQSSTHLMENLQMASGDGVCDYVLAEEIDSSIGGKFEEREEHDDGEEWKYIKEGQQSEKQQQRIKAGIGKDMEGVEDVGNGHGYGYELGDVGADDMLLLDKHEVGNCVVGISAAVDVDAIGTATSIEENEEVLKNDGDFSTTSNTTSTGGEDADPDSGVLQVEMKIEPATILQPQLVSNLFGAGGTLGNFAEHMEEEEPSSLTTNNTTGTNSISENSPQQQLHQEINENLKTEELSIENKENANPSFPSKGLQGGNDEINRPNDLDFETHSQLNPDALEFVPSFGSNPASPIAPTSDIAAFIVGEPALNSDAETQPQPHPSSIARHLLSDDDFVAQSPRKGSVESNLDIALPEENDFEHEAAKRPHELEQEDDLIGVGTVQHSQQLENHNNDGVHLLNEDTNAKEAVRSLILSHSPASIIDHGPETSVDLDADFGIQLCDTDKLAQQQGFVIDAPIEDVLNTVQPLPTDTESLNASLIEERPQQDLESGGKELLDVEEKEYISQSPSTEEMKMNLQNEIHSSVKDIPQIPIDMDDAANMQESFYLESTSTDIRYPHGLPLNADVSTTHALQNANDVTLERATENLIDDSNIPFDQKLIADQISFENICAAKPSGVELEIEFGPDHPSLNIFAQEFTPGQKSVGTDGVSSLMSTEEKHLVEDTKEPATKSETLDELEQKMDDLKLSTKDGILSQVEEVAQTAANIVESLNPFAAPEPEQHKTVEQLPIEADQPFSTESHLHATFLQNNEQFYHNEQQNDHQAKETASKAVYAGFEDNLFSTQQEDQSSACPAKLELEVNRFEEPVAVSISIASPPEPEPVNPAIETPLEPTSVAHLKSANAEPEAETLTEPEYLSQPESSLALKSEPEPDNALYVSNNISNVSTNDEALAFKEVAPSTPGAFLETALDETKKAASETVVAAATIGAIATTAAVATVAATATKKTEAKKPRTPTSLKSKTVDMKKGPEPTKKPIGATTKTSASAISSARPRTAPSKAATVSDKKVTATTAAAKPSTTTSTRKPLTSAAATSRTITKTTTSTRPTTAPTAAKPSVSRTTTTTTATISRRSAPINTGVSSNTSNGTTAGAKPKVAGSVSTKPTTLGLTATAKPKLTSPRTTLTSQLRKVAPASTGTALTTARSPLKSTATTTNGVTKSSTNTTTASRAKSSTSTTITTTTTKTFTARPAPKTTHLSTISSTTARRTVSAVSSSSTTGTRTTGSTLQKKSPPGSARPISAGKSSLSPTKPSIATLKSKTKDEAKKPITPIKPANELKAKATEEQSKLNGTPSTAGGEEQGKQVEQQAHFNGEGDGPQKVFENGMHQEVLGNGEGSILDQHAQESLVDA